MFHKSGTLILAVALLAGTAFHPALAQPRRGAGIGAYERGYSEGHKEGYSDGRRRVRYDDRVPNNGPQYDNGGPRYDSGGPRYDTGDRGQLWRQQYQQQYNYKDDSYYRECRSRPDPAGIIGGALIGGLLGNALGRGNGVPTIAGVVLGGALGASLTNNLDCEDRSYAYKTYYDGFNGGREDVPYRWRNPSNGHYGEFMVQDYYDDRAGFRCANFTQKIFVDGRPQAATGRACQQPDGTWAVVS